MAKHDRQPNDVMGTITTTIKREWLAEIIARRKRVEYRETKPYWINQLSRVKTPFLLRLINGMQPKAPEVTVAISRVRRNKRAGHFALSISRIIRVRYWDRKSERPATK